MDETSLDHLRELLRRKTEGVAKDALSSGGQVPPDRVESLERLARLVEISQLARPRRGPKQWHFAAVFVATLLIASLLLFGRVSETEIELDCSLSEVSFTLSRQQPVLPRLNLAALGVSGLREITVPRSRDADDLVVASSDGGELNLLLSVPSDRARQGSIGIDGLTLPAGTRVGVDGSDAPRQWQLSLSGEPVTLRAGVNGLVSVAPSGAPARQLTFVTPKTVLLGSAGTELRLQLTLRDGSPAALSPQLAVEQLWFSRIEEIVGARDTVVRRLSTILSGTMYLESLNGEEMVLRPGEQIEFAQARGEIRTLRLQGDHLTMKFHGTVRGMSAGIGDARRSLMPTWLEWLRARHGLSLLWGTALYLFGLIAGSLRWWRQTS